MAVAELRATIDGLGQSFVDWSTAGTNVTNALTKVRGGVPCTLPAPDATSDARRNGRSAA